MASTLTPASNPAGGPTIQYVVRAQPGSLAALHRDLTRQATVVRQIGLIDADVVRLTSAQATRLALDPRVVSVTRDASVRLAGSSLGEQPSTLATDDGAPTDAATAPAQGDGPDASSAGDPGRGAGQSAAVATSRTDPTDSDTTDTTDATVVTQAAAKAAAKAQKDAAAKTQKVAAKAQKDAAKAAARAAARAEKDAAKAARTAVKAAEKAAREAAKHPVVTMDDVASDINADDLRASGATGQGIDVALIDSGVAPVDGLRGDKVVHGADLSFDSQSPAVRYNDLYGHGTHLAGIIAGKSADFTGIAPDARIVSVKVADATGQADVSQVIAGIDWVVRHAHSGGMNVRVLNLSFGTDSKQAYQLDPLAYAAEQAWHAGIVVVASVGNDGVADGRLTDPAIDPYILAVGAADTSGAVTRVAKFSGRGDDVRNPDLLAPGAHVASLEADGTLAAQLGGAQARQANGTFLGSGTSQAAAVASGAAALLLSDRPGLTPDQVKALLVGSASSLPGWRVRSQGAGLMDVAAAAAAPVPTAVQNFPRAKGTGSLDAARGSDQVRYGHDRLTGEQDIFGRPWTGPSTDFTGWWSEGLTTTNWGAVAWGVTNWGATAWGSTNWNATAWAATAWAGSAWAGSAWAGTAWGSSAWAATAWAGSAWAGTSWAGTSWAGTSWAGTSWAGTSWA